MTSTEDRVGWVSSGSGRSTSDILWSCFSILLICTWKCIHFNIPSVAESESRWKAWKGVPYWPEKLLWRRWFRRAGFMMLIILAPEIGVSIAMDQYLQAREPQREQWARRYHRMVNESGVDVTNRRKIPMTHAFFANMGGFQVRYSFRLPLEKGETPPEPIVIFLGNWNSLDRLMGMLPDIELPAEEDIDDRSKADLFTKTFASAQCLWLVIQCIARASVGLPITQLELATIAFVACALAMYILWWNKPFGVERRVTIIDRVVTESHVAELELHLTSENREDARTQLEERLREKLFWDLGDQNDSIPDLPSSRVFDIIGLDPKEVRKVLRREEKPHGDIAPRSRGEITERRDTITGVTFYTACTLFSAFHIGAWNWEFPSPHIRTAWRSFAVAATSTGLLAMVLVVSLFVLLQLINRDGDRKESVLDKMLDAFLVLGLGLFFLVYVLARLGLVVLVFYCFSAMPVKVYETVDWAQFLPHFS